MQAIVQDRYGGPEVLITREIERPVIAHAQGKVTVTMALRPGENSLPASASTAHSRAS